jgi:APA family basic amino acid/polyamine antiporter
MSQAAATPGQPELHRVMGPKLLLLFIVGDILGTGVYALTGTVAGEVGGAAWATFRDLPGRLDHRLLLS